ncbi:kinase domain protein (macronuclear) [Tetrahymena thermophila SB210]|uniref:Kinase domain protein n=1 Tax=Tetrahymena thermophila (strain SB210) TaxID=312017 RepID=W7X426_TETTS|nr:kinase domain protein [Tetrahymena thermophila SB210]EWS71173.1 kinase domain protein [Tetrahymena thermophila SB210]|eukprot:XP_012656271.1 kinase domain protein [Tetrahymena thermophila SB210]
MISKQKVKIINDWSNQLILRELKKQKKKQIDQSHKIQVLVKIKEINQQVKKNRQKIYSDKKKKFQKTKKSTFCMNNIYQPTLINGQYYHPNPNQDSKTQMSSQNSSNKNQELSDRSLREVFIQVLKYSSDSRDKEQTRKHNSSMRNNNQAILIEGEGRYLHPNQDLLTIISSKFSSNKIQESSERREITIQLQKFSSDCRDKEQIFQSSSCDQKQIPAELTEQISNQCSSPRFSYELQLHELKSNLSYSQVQNKNFQQVSQDECIELENKFKQFKQDIIKKLNNYALGSQIGKGGESLIYEDQNNQEQIIKIIFSSTNELIENQKKIFAKLINFKKFIQLVEHIKIDDNLHIFIHKKYQQSLWQELLQFNQNENKFTDEKFIKIIFDLIQGLIDLKIKEILHLDIKPDNILIDDRGNYIYIDFGISQIYENGKNMVVRGISDKYSSYEQKNDTNNISYKSDVYSLGRTLQQVIEKFEYLNPQSQIKEFVQKFIKNIVNNQMVKEAIHQRSDCQLIHYLFSEQLLNIQDKLDRTFIKEIGFEINRYLNLQQTEIVIQPNVKRQIELLSIIDVFFFYLNFNKNIEIDGFANIIKEIQLNSEQPTELIIYWEKNIIKEDIVDDFEKFIQKFTQIKIYFNEAELYIENKEGFKNTYQYLNQLKNGDQFNQNLSLEILTKKRADNFEHKMKNSSNFAYLYLQLSEDEEYQKKTNIFLEKFKNVSHLNLNLFFNKIDVNKVLTLTQSLKKCQYLTQLNLNLNNNQICSEGIQQLASFIEMNKSITKLDLHLFSNQVGERGVIYLNEALKRSENIAELNLDLSFNRRAKQAGISIGQGLQKYKNIVKLTLNFHKIEIGYEGIWYLANGLINCQNITQLNLNISCCGLKKENSKDAIVTLFQGLLKCQKMTHLILNLSLNKIRDEDFVNEELNVEQNKKLTYLNLEYCSGNVGPFGLKYIAKFIEKYDKLQQLDLAFRNNEINDDGIQFLGSVVENCQNISKLSLNLNDNNRITKYRAQKIQYSLENCQRITQLKLEF